MRAQSLNALGQVYPDWQGSRAASGRAGETAQIALDDHHRARDELPAMARSLVEGAGRVVKRAFFNDLAEACVPCPILAAGP